MHLFMPPLAFIALLGIACDLPDVRIVELSTANFSKLEGIGDTTGLRVDNRAGAVRVYQGGPELEATLAVHGDNTEVEIRVVDGLVTFETDCGLGVCLVEYDLHVPEGWSVSVANGSGSVSVESLDAAFLVVDTSSGTIGVTDVTSGTVDLDSGSGGVTIADLTADSIVLDTGAGGVTGSALRTRDIVSSTGSGAVNLEVLAAPERLLVTTGSGGVRVTVPRSNYRLLLSTGSGGINIDELEDDPTSEQVLEISTGSGGIQLGPM